MEMVVSSLHMQAISMLMTRLTLLAHLNYGLEQLGNMMLPKHSYQKTG